MKWILGVAVLAAGGWLVTGAMAQDGDTAPGLVAAIYSFGDTAVEDFPDVKDKKPDVKRIDKEINVDVGDDNWPGTKFGDHYYIVWTGTVKVEKDGKYTFYTESDDGSRLSIAGKKVVDNGGLHAMEEQSGEVELKAGVHEIKVEMFENEGQAGCKVSWKPPGSEKQIIPASAFAHKKSEEEGLTK